MKEKIFLMLEGISVIIIKLWKHFLVIVDLIVLHQRSKLILLFVGIVLGIVIAYFLTTGSMIGLIKLTLTPAVIFTSVLLAARQFLYTREWNQKNTALNILYTSRKETAEAEKFMRNVFDISSNEDKQKPLSIVELHNILGVFLSDGTFVFHGNEKEEDGNQTQKISTEFLQHFKKIKDKNDDIVCGKEVLINIVNILNEYEYIALGCKQHAFDTQTVVRLAGPRIVTVFNFYANYIYHLRHDDRHKESKSLYRELEWLANEICEKYGVDTDYPKIIPVPTEEEYSTPFDKAKD